MKLTLREPTTGGDVEVPRAEPLAAMATRTLVAVKTLT